MDGCSDFAPTLRDSIRLKGEAFTVTGIAGDSHPHFAKPYALTSGSCPQGIIPSTIVSILHYRFNSKTAELAGIITRALASLEHNMAIADQALR